MSIVNGAYPTVKGVNFEAVTISPAATQTLANSIAPGVKSVRLAANVTDVNDFTVLPSLASVQDGHQITILAGVANSELRTPATSGEKINGQDSDGTKEALLTATDVHFLTKIDNTIGWMLEARTAIGAYVTAIIPD